MGDVLGLIPARGGSKGIPGKNAGLLHGRPLMSYTVAAARASGVIDRLILSTDSDELAGIGRSLGVEVPFTRPPELAADDTPMLPVVQHALRELEKRGWFAELVVLLQPTSPLRRPEHVRDAVTRLRETRADSVVSVVALPLHFSPDYVLRMEAGYLVPFIEHDRQVTRRQDVRPAYVRDGTVYATRRDVAVDGNSLYGARCVPLVIPADESATIDTPEDWHAVEQRLARRPNA